MLGEVECEAHDVFQLVSKFHVSLDCVLPQGREVTDRALELLAVRGVFGKFVALKVVVAARKSGALTALEMFCVVYRSYVQHQASFRDVLCGAHVAKMAWIDCPLRGVQLGVIRSVAHIVVRRNCGVTAALLRRSAALVGIFVSNFSVLRRISV